MKYTIKDFRADFPNDKTCLAFIFNNRYPKGLSCPKCDKSSFHAVEGRRSYACACGFQIYPTEGTIFHKSSTPLTLWFHAIFLMSQSKNGVAAKELERQLGVTYKCAWRMARQIRLLMTDDDGPLGDNEIVELDETSDFFSPPQLQGKKMKWVAPRPTEDSVLMGAVKLIEKTKIEVESLVVSTTQHKALPVEYLMSLRAPFIKRRDAIVDNPLRFFNPISRRELKALDTQLDEIDLLIRSVESEGIPPERELRAVIEHAGKRIEDCFRTLRK